MLHTAGLTYPQAKRPRSVAGLVEPVLKPSLVCPPLNPHVPALKQTAHGPTACSLQPAACSQGVLGQHLDIYLCLLSSARLPSLQGGGIIGYPWALLWPLYSQMDSP